MNPSPELHAHAGLRLPRVVQMRVIPIAGHDGMLLNLSGAHGPFFTRNLVVLSDDAGHTGVGEVPGGERIRQTLEDARAMVDSSLQKANRTKWRPSDSCRGS